MSDLAQFSAETICVDCALGEGGHFHDYHRKRRRRTIRCVLLGCCWETPNPLHPEYRDCVRCRRVQHLGHSDSALGAYYFTEQEGS